jgi:hypothetical protein
MMRPESLALIRLQLGEFSRNLFTEFSSFAASQLLVQAVDQVRDIDPAALRIPLLRLPLKVSERERFLKLLLKWEHHLMLLNGHSKDGNRRRSVEYESWRGILPHFVNYPLRRVAGAVWLLLGRRFDSGRLIHVAYGQGEDDQQRP